MKKRKNNWYNRILAILLIAVMVLSYVPGSVFAQNGEEFRIVSKARSTDPLSFFKNEKTVISVTGTPEGSELQWQIAMPNGEGWVDIMDQEDMELRLSYALIASVMDENGITSIRCTAEAKGEVHTTAAVTVQVLPEETIIVEPMQTMSKTTFSAEKTTVPAEETTVPNEETIVPTEEITIPTEEATAPTEETAAPTQECTAPTEETTVPDEETTIPTEETTIPTEETTVPTEMTTEPRIAENNRMRSSASAVPEGDPVEFVTVTVNYMKDTLGNGVLTQLYDPYIARIQKGSALTINEKNPVDPGYAPYLDDVELGTVFYRELTSEDTQSSIEFTIVYKRIPVNYEVRYFLQNLSNDQYTEDAALHTISTGLTGEQPDPDDINKYIEGYSSLFYQPDSIAADGSTVFECYYDRNYYLINFDLNGGYGTAPIYARYGTSFTPAAPTREGYVFVGWDLVKTEKKQPVYIQETDEAGNPVMKIKRDDDGEIVMEIVINNTLEDGVADEMPYTIPGENRTYKAIWTTADTTFTIAYWLQNADDDNYSYITSKSDVDAYSGTVMVLDGIADGDKAYPLPTDELAKYSELDPDKTDDQYKTYTVNGREVNGVMIEGDGSTVFNIYYKRKEYTLKFFYAAEQDGKYYVVGGSTYYFGEQNASANKTDDVCKDEIKLLDCFFGDMNGQWGQVESLPVLETAIAQKNIYTISSATSIANANRKYHFIQFSARYGANIYDLWPCNVFQRAKLTTTGTYGEYAYPSAWNGEYYVEYSQTESNETIKGKYEKLDNRLLFSESAVGKVDDLQTVSYLCFWENGTTNVTWNKPRLWVYRILVQDVDNPGEYVLRDHYATCDNDDAGNQTQVSLEGFTANRRAEFEAGGDPPSYVNLQEWRPETYKFLNENGYLTDKYYTEYLIIDFYYTRNSYELSFANRGTQITQRNTWVPYEKAVSSNTYFFVPDYPKGLEADAYEFEGWYTTSECYASTEFWNKEGTYVGGSSFSLTDSGEPMMPDNNVSLFANWVPKTYTVEFYWNYNDLATGASARVYDNQTVSHGKKLIGTTIDNPSYEVVDGIHPNPHYDPETDAGLYEFAGWFYMDGNDKVAFDPNEMVYTQDMKLFAEWKTKITTSYTIRYLQAAVGEDGNLMLDENNMPYPATDSDGNVIVLADPTEGYIFTGSTKTFTAKAGSDLAAPPSGQMWLPYTSSHSILMDKNPANNTYDFLYISKNAIKYTIEYRYAETNALIESLDQDLTTGVPGTDIVSTTNSVISELPPFLSGYTSSPAFVTLVLSLNEDKNVVTFYYTKNPDPGSGETVVEKNHYIIHHMVQNLYDPYAFIEQETDSGTEVFDTVIQGEDYKRTFTGFEYCDQLSVQSGDQAEKIFYSGTEKSAEEKKPILEGTIGTEIVEMWLYYKRMEYPYVVKYLKYGTDEPVEEQKEDRALYNSVVTETALEIEGFDLVSANTQQKTIAVEDADYDALKLNVIKFYYQEKEVVINYLPVFEDPYQNLNPDMISWLTLRVERPVEYTNIEGSTPCQPAGYKFVGWFYDEDCTKPVASPDSIDGNTNELTPEVTTETAIQKNYVYNFYAKFEPITGSLKIEKKVTGTDANGDSFIFTIRSENALCSPGDLVVTVKGNSSVTIHNLYYGTYVVDESNWSWAYTKLETQPGNGTVIIDVDGETEIVEFTNTYHSPDWLHGESVNENQFN